MVGELQTDAEITLSPLFLAVSGLHTSLIAGFKQPIYT